MEGEEGQGQREGETFTGKEEERGRETESNYDGLFSYTIRTGVRYEQKEGREEEEKKRKREEEKQKVI